MLESAGGFDCLRQGKHWNLDHPIYKKYRPAVAGPSSGTALHRVSLT